MMVQSRVKVTMLRTLLSAFVGKSSKRDEYDLHYEGRKTYELKTNTSAHKR